MSRTRKIAPLATPGITPGGADMPEPRFERAKPRDLMVDETYQRDLSERSVRLIRKIVSHWDWRTFMPPVVVRTAGGLHVIDGQHTAIAAASHPKIDDIPVMVVDADVMADRAKAFLGRNRDRIVVTPTQLHAAAVIAGDDDAVTIDQVCRRAGIRILKNPPAAGFFQPGDTLAIKSVASLVSRRGAMRARQVLEPLAAAKIAPVPAAVIKAAEELLCGDDWKGKITPASLTTELRRDTDGAITRAKSQAIVNDMPLWKALVIELGRRCKRGS